MSGSIASLVGSVKSSAIVITNYVTNGTFESTNMTPWISIGDSGPMVRSNSAAHSGAYSGKFRYDTLNSTMEASYFVNVGPLSSQKRYSLSAWVMTTNQTYNGVNWSYDFGGSTSSGFKTLSLANTWYKITAANILPGPDGYIVLDFQMSGFPSSGNFYIDDVYIIEGATPF